MDHAIDICITTSKNKFLQNASIPHGLYSVKISDESQCYLTGANLFLDDIKINVNIYTVDIHHKIAFRQYHNDSAVILYNVRVIIFFPYRFCG